MTSDDYRRRSIAARHRSAAVSDPEVRASLLELSDCWLALAEQAEWLEARYGAAMSDKFFQSGSQRKKKE